MANFWPWRFKSSPGHQAFMDYPFEIKVGEKVFPVEYESSLKGTSSVRLKKGVIKMKLSRFIIGRGREEMIEKFLKWAEKKISKMSTDSFIEPDYVDGGRIVTHNKIYDLRIIDRDGRKNNRTIVDGGVVEVFINGDSHDLVKELVEKAIVKDQINYLREVVSELNDLYFRERYNLVRFKRTTGRFGSCSSLKNINISFRLLFAPREVFRYVCIHELAHLKQMNHSKKFWDLVEEAMPEYSKSEKWLKHNGFALG